MSVASVINSVPIDWDKYEALYKSLHNQPELSLYEEETASCVAKHLSALPGFQIKTSIGGHGVVGILQNGTGKVVLLRAELDALPLEEKTGLPYSSTKSMRTATNPEPTPAMHACGHDLHMSALLAAAEMFHSCRQHWQGTLIVLFQPSEENAYGAKAMVDDGLYDPARHAVPVPDILLGGHCMPMRAGLVKTRVGPINASADSFKVTIFGRGGHAARPHNTADAVIIACNIVTKLQQITSRQVNPLEVAVLTVSSIHAGSALNVIANEAVLGINIRTFDSNIRDMILSRMKTIIESEAQIYSVPKLPHIEQVSAFPLLANDETETAIVGEALKQHFGKDFGFDAVTSTGSEDFAALSVPSGAIPIVFWNYGCISADVWDDAEKKGTTSEIPGNHSPYFAPVLQPSLKVGTEAYCVAALSYLKK